MSIDISVTCNPVEVNVTDDIIEISQVGLQGPQGPAGPGVPQGGTTGQILAKIDGTNYNTEWIDNYTTDIRENIKAGEAINKGQAVYISGADGTNIIVRKASNSTESTSSKTIGLLAQNLANNGQGFVITEGKLSGLNTTGAVVGDPVWLGVNGNLLYGAANKPVAPANLVYLGVVTRVNANNGEIFIHVINGFELEELHNVKITNPTNGEVLKYNSTTGLWENGADASSNIYNSNGTLTGNRTVTLNGNYLRFSEGIEVDGTSGGSTVYIGARGAAGDYNIAIGSGAMDGPDAGLENIVIGYDAAENINDARRNTIVGYEGANSLTTGNNNTGIGSRVLHNLSTGNFNTGLGSQALRSINSGSNNIGIGYESGRLAGFVFNQQGSNSIFIGNETQPLDDAQTNQIVIGHQAIGNGSNTITLGNDSIINTYLKGVLNASNLSGTGTRMVVANDTGVLSTQAIPTGNPGTVTSIGLTSATTGLTITNTPITSSGNINLEIATASGSQNGLLSSTDWTTFNNKQNALTNPITGTGASGQVAYWNGTNTQTGSNNLFWDATNNRFRIGGAADTGQRLQVNGDTLLKGSGNTSGTTALTVQNSDGTNAFRVRNDGTILISGFQMFPFTTAAAAPNIAGTNLSFYSSNSVLSASNGRFAFFGLSMSQTSGDNYEVYIGRNFSPTSGTATYGQLALITTINQTGGANGITRGLYINPTLTAAADWRSIEMSNNSGWGIYQTGASAKNYFAGNTLIGTTTDSGQRLQVNGDTLLKGSGNTSGTTALTVQNSDGVNMLKISNGSINYLGSSTSYFGPGSRLGGPSVNGRGFIFHDNGTTDTGTFFYISGNAFTTTSGSLNNLGSIRAFAPTSGTSTYTEILSRSTINQTGGANGITRGLYVNPTLTAAADWRSIETSNNTGWAAYFAGSADIFVGDGADIQIGATNGTKIGTSTSQKIGFWNATPVVQPTTAIAEATFVENSGGTTVNVDSTFAGYTLQQIAQALKNMGILA